MKKISPKDGTVKQMKTVNIFFAINVKIFKKGIPYIKKKHPVAELLQFSDEVARQQDEMKCELEKPRKK